MFSKRSVRVQPSEPPIEYGGVPDDLIVFPAARSCVNVVGAFTPAALNAGTLYQTSDLFAALNVSAYSFPLNVPSAFHGCAKSAMSGGWPPATAVASTVGRSLPTGL